MSETTNFHRSENSPSRPCSRVLCIFVVPAPFFVGRRQPSTKTGGLSRKRRGLLHETSLVFRKSAQLFSKRCLERVKSGGNKTQKALIYKEMHLSIPYSSLRAIGLTQVGSATRRRAHFNPRAATSRREFGLRSCLTPQKKERIFTLKIKPFP